MRIWRHLSHSGRRRLGGARVWTQRLTQRLTCAAHVLPRRYPTKISASVWLVGSHDTAARRWCSEPLAAFCFARTPLCSRRRTIAPPRTTIVISVSAPSPAAVLPVPGIVAVAPPRHACKKQSRNYIRSNDDPFVFAAHKSGCVCEGQRSLAKKGSKHAHGSSHKFGTWYLREGV